MVSTPTTLTPATVDAHYVSILVHVLEDLADKAPANGVIDTVLSIDAQRGTYTLLLIGWEGHERVRDVIACLRVKNDRIVLEVDNVEPPLLEMLLDAGIPAERIALGFQENSSQSEHTSLA